MHRINDGTIEPKSGDTAAHTGRVDWVDLAKGISIALVVLLHSTNFLVTRGLAAGIWNDINAVAEPIRMPLFFLTAGLFAHKVTSLPWATVIRRRVLPLAYLYLMWTVLRFVFFSAFPATAGTDETSSPLNLITALVVPTSGLWFLYALAVYTVLTKALGGIDYRVQLLGAIVLAFTAPSIGGVDWTWGNMMELFLFFLAGTHLQQMIRAAAASTTVTRLALSGTAFALAYALHINGYITSVGAATITLSALGLLVGITLTSQLQALRIFAPFRKLGTLTLPVYLMHEVLLGIIVVAAVHAGFDFTRNALLVFGPLLVAGVAVGGSLAIHAALTSAGQRWLFVMPRRGTS
ncbi:acyltransferase family protein [Rhodococcus sp. WY5]|uniref:acyltransferase family protein n=1 Tax=Rhodococcus TaxID=1827 RepID=UPI001BDE9FA4|nr:acyltransferase family protein [Rhodococcus sp. WY5]